MEFDRNLMLMVILTGMLLIPAAYFGVILGTNSYSNTQNQGFFSSTETWSLGAVPENQDVSIQTASISMIYSNYKREYDTYSYQYQSEDHPNPYSEMNGNLPITIAKLNVSFGSQVPFTLNGTDDVVISQQLIFSVAVYDSETGLLAQTKNLIVNQNATSNSLFRQFDVEYNSINPNESLFWYKQTQNFNVYDALKMQYTYENGSKSVIRTSSYVFSSDSSSGGFFAINGASREQDRQYPDFSVIYYNEVLTTAGFLLFTSGLVLLTSIQLYRRR